MAESSAALRKSAKGPGARSCTPKCTSVHSILPFELFLRAVWPVDTVKQVGRVTGKSLRAIKYQLAGRDPAYHDIVAIIRSEHGYDFLQHVMGEANPKWWRTVQHARGIGALRKQVAEQSRRIAQLELAID